MQAEYLAVGMASQTFDKPFMQAGGTSCHRLQIPSQQMAIEIIIEANFVIIQQNARRL